MGKSSRTKRRTYQTPKRSRNGANTIWYAAAAVLVIAGSLAVALSRSNTASGVGPTPPDHWHAALGVDDCGSWVPNWLWPPGTGPNGPARAGTNGQIYAGLHSHGDGLIHMEPRSNADGGKNATVGEYFDFGGWKLSETSISFNTAIKKNGDKCNGKPGVLRWAVNGKERHGNPAKYKLFEGDVVELVFTSRDAKLPPKTDVPSYAQLQKILGNPSQPDNPPGVTTPVSGATTTPPTTTAPTASTASTATTVGSTTTSKP